MREHEINLSKSGSTAWCADRERKQNVAVSISRAARGKMFFCERQRSDLSSCATCGRCDYPHLPLPLSFLILSFPHHFSLQSVYDSTS